VRVRVCARASVRDRERVCRFYVSYAYEHVYGMYMNVCTYISVYARVYEYLYV